MTSNYNNVLTNKDIDYILNLPEVIDSKYMIDNKINGFVNFNIKLNNLIKQNIYNKIGLNLFNCESIPMKWIKGDTMPHIDKGTENNVLN